MSDPPKFLECGWDCCLYIVEDWNYRPSCKFPHTMELYHLEDIPIWWEECCISIGRRRRGRGEGLSAERPPERLCAQVGVLPKSWIQIIIAVIWKTPHLILCKNVANLLSCVPHATTERYQTLKLELIFFVKGCAKPILTKNRDVSTPSWYLTMCLPGEPWKLRRILLQGHKRAHTSFSIQCGQASHA